MSSEVLVQAPWIGVGISLSALIALLVAASTVVLSMREWGYGVPWRTRVPLGALALIFGWRAWALYEERVLTDSGLIVLAVMAAAAFVCLLELVVQAWRKVTKARTEAETTRKVIDSIHPTLFPGLYEVDATRPPNEGAA